MGTWDVSVTANDMAQDLIGEYRAAFFYNDIQTALDKIEKYIRAEIADESDEEIWCDYMYSLSDFMWKKGILTENLKLQVLEMLHSNYGLDIWKEEGIKTLNARKIALQKFEAKLLSPQPEQKKITMDVKMNVIFQPGDIVVFQLKTVGKDYTADWKKIMSKEVFHDCDCKYVAVQKIMHYSSWTSRVEPNVNDYWCVFRLFDKVFDKIPDIKQVLECSDVDFFVYNKFHTPLFSCESKLYYFKQRKYILLGNDTTRLDKYKEMRSEDLYFKDQNMDAYLLASMKNI